jgi:hypothetical protein
MKMEKNEIEKLLIEWRKIAAERAQFAQGYAEMREKLIPPEVKAELEALDVESKTALESVDTKLAVLTEQIKAGTLAYGETIKVDGVAQAVYRKGTTTWDTKGIEGLAVAIPELLKFRKIGEPSVAIR